MQVQGEEKEKEVSRPRADTYLIAALIEMT